MSRRPLVSLCLAVLLSGCGQELRSPECEQGKPVVAAGKFHLSRLYSDGDSTSVTAKLLVEEGGVSREVSEVKLDEPADFPLAFTLCAELGELSAEAKVWTSLRISRGALMGPIGDSFVIPYDGTPSEDLEFSVGGGEPFLWR